jgi:hypothetical protein
MMPLVSWAAEHLPESVVEHLDFEPDSKDAEDSETSQTPAEEVAKVTKPGTAGFWLDQKSASAAPVLVESRTTQPSPN